MPYVLTRTILPDRAGRARVAWPAMDVDAYITAHRAEWDRLEVLVRTRRLTGAESDELVDLYQRVATHLSVVQTRAPDPDLVGPAVVAGRAGAGARHRGLQLGLVAASPGSCAWTSRSRSGGPAGG